MELSEYIRNVLNEIVKGISEVQTDTKNTEAVIAPDWKTKDQLVHLYILILPFQEAAKIPARKGLASLSQLFHLELKVRKVIRNRRSTGFSSAFQSDYLKQKRWKKGK